MMQEPGAISRAGEVASTRLSSNTTLNLRPEQTTLSPESLQLR